VGDSPLERALPARESTAEPCVWNGVEPFATEHR